MIGKSHKIKAASYLEMNTKSQQKGTRSENLKMSILTQDKYITRTIFLPSRLTTIVLISYVVTMVTCAENVDYSSSASW